MSDCPQLLTPLQQKHIQRQNSINQRRHIGVSHKKQQQQDEADKVLYKLGLMSLKVKNETTKRRPSEISDEEKEKTKAGLEFCSMVALQGDGEKMALEADQIAKRLGIEDDDDNDDKIDVVDTVGVAVGAGVDESGDGGGMKDENALKFCFEIPESQRSASVWKLGANILCDMKFFVSAEEWIRRCNDRSLDGDAEAQLLFQEIRTKRFFSHVTKDLEAEVGFTIEKFRGLYAKKKLEEGESVVVEEPILFSRAYSSNPDENFPACNFCGKDLATIEDYFGDVIEKLIREVPPVAADLKEMKSLWPDVTTVRCSTCEEEEFCSDECRRGYWEKHHRYLCPGVNRHAVLLRDAYAELRRKGRCEESQHKDIFKELSCNSTPMMLLKMWGIILSDAFKLAEELGKKVTLKEYQTACEPFRSFIGARFPFAESARPLFSCLEAILADASAFPTPFTLNENEFEWRYSQIASNVQEFRPPESNLETWMSAVRSNGEERFWKLLQLAVRKSSKKIFPRPPIFSGLFVLHATTNHSCNHNCKVTSVIQPNGRVAVDVVALRRISVGEELCIRYADVTLPRKERRDYLYKGWGFWCMCEKCKYEGDDQNICIHCLKVAEQEENFLACGRCKRAWYCGKECQRKSWNDGHKSVCQNSMAKGITTTTTTTTSATNTSEVD